MDDRLMTLAAWIVAPLIVVSLLELRILTNQLEEISRGLKKVQEELKRINGS